VLAGKDINTHYATDEYIALLARQKSSTFPGKRLPLQQQWLPAPRRCGSAREADVAARVRAAEHLRPAEDDGHTLPRRQSDDHSTPRRGVLRVAGWGRVGVWSTRPTSTALARRRESTVRDLALWDHSFDTGALGGPSFRATMLTRGVLNSGDSIPYALALIHGQQGGLPTIGHSGSSLGFRADYLRFPTQHLSFFVLCNTPTNPSRFAAQVAQLYLVTK